MKEPHVTLMKHQVPAVAHLLRRPCGGLLMDPGTGKTLAVLAAYHALRKKKLVDKLIVFAPLNPLYETWPAEIAEWGFDFSIAMLHGSKKDEAIDKDADVYLINYDGIEWLADNIKRLLRHGKRWWAVFDESTKIKHTNTQRFKELKPLLPRFGRRSILTGTPIPNGYEDLFGQVYAVDLGEALGRFITQYRRDYFYPTGYGGYSYVLQEGAGAKIEKLLDGMFFRVDDSVLNLPPLHPVPKWVRLTPKAQRAYDSMKDEFVAELRSGLITAVNAGVKSGKLRQIANGFVYSKESDRFHKIHDEKIEAVEDLLEELQGSPLLVGYEFEADKERLALALEKRYRLEAIDGNRARNKQRFAAFNAGELDVLLCQTGAVAHGLNLQKRCWNVALFGLPWNLETYQQFIKRVHRKGQKHMVIAHHVMARGTIDETVWSVLHQKDRRQAALLKALKRRYL